MSLSLLGKRWVSAPSVFDLSKQNTQGLSPLIQRCLETTPIPGSLSAWLNPSFEHLCDPFLMKGMKHV